MPTSDDDTAIVRTHKDTDNPYVLISRALVDDINLSWAARGVLTYLLSKPNNWTIQLGDLINRGNLKRDGIRAIFKELKKYGYLHRSIDKQKGPGGRIRWITEIYEQPSLNPRFLQKLPSTACPATACPATANPPLNNKEYSNNNISIDTPPASPDSLKKKKNEKERPRDLVFDGFVAACKYNPAMLDGVRGPINRSASILRKWYKGILTEEQLYNCLVAFPEFFYLDETKDGQWRKRENVKITPAGIIKIWHEFAWHVGLPEIAEN